MLKIRRPLGRLIFNMGIAIPGKTVFLIETAPWSLQDMYGTKLKNMGSSHIEAVTKWLPFSRHFQTHFVEWNYYILVKISLKYAPQGPIDTIPSLVQIMAWRRAGDKPLSKPMKFSLMTHIYIYASLDLNELTHWGRHKMAAIPHTAVSKVFSSKKMWEFQLNFHWSLFLRV